jgi:polyvinyl alcohol dehydrogenase (cytochrome)
MGRRHLGLLAFAMLWFGLAGATYGNPVAIGPGSVAGLQLLWSVPLKGPSRGMPVADGDAIFVTTTNGYLTRFDRRTGTIAWQLDLASVLEIPGASAAKIVAVADGRVIFGLHNAPFVVAVSEDTGTPLWKVKVDDHPGAVISQPPTIVGGRVFIGVSGLGEEVSATTPPYVCCSFRGSVLALDAATGKQIWKTYTVPEGYAGGSVWSGAPLWDQHRNALYVTTGNAFRVPAAVQACVDSAKGDRQAQSACYPAGTWYDSILALDPGTGAVKWGFRAENADIFTGACLVRIGGYCGGGEDYDFGNGALMWRAGGHAYVGAGQKAGIFWALDPDTGTPVWSTKVGPGGPTGGIEYGSAVAGGRIYVAESNTKQVGHDAQPYTLPSGLVIDYGSYAALDAATGKIVWQVPVPAGADHPDNGKPCHRDSPREDCAGAYAKGAVAAADGLVFACSTAPAGPLYALDARSGAVLWTYKAGAPCDTRAAVIDGRLYWVAGAALNSFGFPGKGATAPIAASARPAGPTVADGVYSAAQADRGKALYVRDCATGCHSENLAGGGPTPSLAGPDFRSRWNGISLAELFKKIRTTMPKSSPGSLGEADYLAIMSYVLAANDFPAGSTDLTGDPAVLERIAIINR